MNDLVKRLRIKAGMIEMGEMIAWGSDSALMREAADALEMAAPAVQGEPVAFCEDAALSIAEQTFNTEVGEQLANDIIQYAQRLHSLYAAPQPAEQQPLKSSLALDASVHLTNWLDMNWCECEGGHTCGYNEVKRTRDALLVAAENQPAPDVSGLVVTLKSIEEWVMRYADPKHPVATVARKALAGYRKQGGEA